MLARSCRPRRRVRPLHLVPLAAAIAMTVLLPACGSEEPAAPEPSPASEAVQANPPAAPSPANVSPEDRVDDAALEAPVRAKAEELNAVRPENVLHLPIGSEVVVLTRGRNSGGLYGSGPYTLDSDCRKAGIHAGLLKEGELGLLRLRVFKHDAEHPSVPAHGVHPNAWGPYHASYTLERVPRD